MVKSRRDKKGAKQFDELICLELIAPNTTPARQTGTAGSQATMFTSLPCAGDPQQQRTRASSSARLFGMNLQFNLSRSE